MFLFQGSNPGYQSAPPGIGSFAPNASLTGPPPAQNIPHVGAPNPGPKGFMTISNAGVQRPGMSSMQPPSPQAAPTQSPVTPAAPPPTVQTADTSNVPGKLTLFQIRITVFLLPFASYLLFVISE